MIEIRTQRRRAARLLSCALMLTLASGLGAPRAFAQGATAAPPVAPPVAPPTAPAAPPLAPPPAPAPTPAPVLPAPPPPPPTKEQLAEAKKFFEAGLKLSKEGLYQEALASFLEANRLAPRESIQNNLARTYRQLKDMAAAYDAYEILLSRYGDKMKPALKNEAQHALEELDVLTGVVTIGVQEPGGKASIDLKDVGVTPITKPIRLNIGQHAIAILKDGFEPLAQTLDIRGHDVVPVNGPLVKTVLTGHLSIGVAQTIPADLTVKLLLDGKDIGSPPFQGDLDPGLHTIEAKGEVAAAPLKQIQIEKKGNYTETLELHVQQGTIAVNVDVADSEIALDGKLVARGVFEGPEPIGTHALTVTKVGFAQYKKDLIVHDGEKVVENVALQKEAPTAAAPPPHDWSGVYSQLAFIGLFEVTKPSNDVAQGVGYTPDTQISGSSIFGGGLNIRVGYSFGILGIEGAVLLDYDHSSAVVQVNTSTVTHPGETPRQENYDFHRAGGTAGIGLRLMPKTQVVRPTLGVGGGVALKAAFYERTIAGDPSLPANPAFYAAPAFFADGGIELGSTPGTRFYLGCLLEVDVAGATQSAPSSYNSPSAPAPTQLNVVNGTDVFIGPILGLQFGE